MRKKGKIRLETTRLFIIHVKNAIFGGVCSQFWLSVRNSAFEVFLIEIQEEIHHFAGLGGGGGPHTTPTKLTNKISSEQTGRGS